MGVIKGSEKAFAYVNLSSRNYPCVCGDRDSLYNCFELYSKLKHERYGYDMADRTYAILKVLSYNPLKGQPVDYLYVDEVQDNLIIDTILLRILCRNADGLFWAGDTAQTISAGSSFRFSELKAFIHRVEAKGGMGIPKCCAKPEQFELAINYRSHGGIVNCAQSVVKLLTDFWPHSIDVLQPECAMLGGPKPVFFAGSSNESLPYEPFFSGLNGNRELGAEQCILVRDSIIRDQIRQRYGDIAVILTLPESKGLEFDDVFLYNFFEDSPAQVSQWRIVLMADDSQETTPSRDVRETPHSVLCTELKNLYVGITRARKRLFLLDHSHKSEPMREFWSKDGLIDVAPPGNISQYIGESTPEQWAASGYKLFNAGQFQEAIRCFERANLPTQLRIAQAYRLREVAMLTSQARERQKAFLSAAEAFVECAGEAHGTQKTSFYGAAAKCYGLADSVHQAAKFYINADDFAGAAKQYHKAGCFDEIAQILKRYHEKIAKSYKNELLYICVVHYSRNGLRPPTPLFSETEEELKYLEDKGLHQARIDLLASLGRFLEVAEIQLLNLGRPCDAIRTLLEHQDNQPGAMQRAVDIALDILWRECSFDTAVHDILQSKEADAYKILSCIKDIPLASLKLTDSREIRFFRTVQKSPSAKEIYQLGEEFSDQKENTMALMAFDVFYSRMPTLHSVHPSEFDNFLRRFERYIRLLASIVSGDIPLRATDPQVRKVFGIVPSSDHHYSITTGSFLHRKFTQNRHLSADIDLLLNARLKERLRQKVVEENNISCIARAFSPPCPFSLLHDCRCYTTRCNHQHLRRTSLNAALYNMKVNLHLQQILILDLMFTVVGGYKDWYSSMMAGLHRLYAAIYCPIYVAGSIADLDWNLVRNAAECINAARTWIQKAIEYLVTTDDPTKEGDYLMNIIRVTCLHKVLGGDFQLQEYVSRSECCPIFYGTEDETEVGDDDVSVDVVTSLINLDPILGMSALRFLLQNGVGMDLSVVCNFVEEICSMFVLSLRPSHSSPLHGLLVPRRWVMDPNKPDTSRYIMQRFLYQVQRLMDLLRFGRAHTKFDLPPDEASFVDIILVQLCRMLYILGYNVLDAGLSKTIAEILFLPPLEVDDTRNPSPQILRQLADRRLEYLKTIQALDNGSAIKDLILLVHNDRHHRTSSLHYIPRLVFETAADITRRLNRTPAF
ncbi:hypothetical protein BKA82DRAFT_4205805 [Pisolithus tinctorius]|nr:hypothetical protein BKA82DRAFT_4205805 [Pisolithus tinctorius]